MPANNTNIETSINQCMSESIVWLTGIFVSSLVDAEGYRGWCRESSGVEETTAFMRAKTPLYRDLNSGICRGLGFTFHPVPATTHDLTTSL